MESGFYRFIVKCHRARGLCCFRCESLISPMMLDCTLRRFVGVILALLLCSNALLQPIPATAETTQSKPDNSSTALSDNFIHDNFIHDPVALRKSMPLVQWRKNGFLNHLYQFDQDPLGSRTPVILIPGRAQEFQNNAWWKKFDKLSRKDAAFGKHFKLYAFIYDSSQYIHKPTEDYTRELKAAFADFSAQNRQVIVVSYSLGGMIIRDAFADKAVANLTHTVFGIAVPYHGSPIFDAEWFTEYFKPLNHSPIRQFWDRTVYRFYFYGKDNLKAGLGWNNFDHSKPFYGEVKVADTLQGTMLISRIQTYQEPAHVEAFKKKLIIYASYLPNQYTEAPGNFKVSTLLGKPLVVPKAVIGSVLPLYGKSVHSVFTYMNQQIARLPTFTASNPKGEKLFVYRYNDGVIPLSSMLYLPARETPYDEDLEGLLNAADVKQVRLFKNIDHMHIGQYSFSKSRIEAPDSLKPDDGRRTPLAWVLFDLNHIAESPLFVNHR